jgi:hypothetical protein
MRPTPSSWKQVDTEMAYIAYDLDLKKFTDSVKDFRA